MKKTTFGILIGTRGFFNPELAKQGRKEAISVMEELGFDHVILSEGDTRFGVVETMDDAKKCAKLFRDNYEKIDGVVVCLPNFGDEIGVAATLDIAKLDVPVLVQASDDELDKMDIDRRRDSFCGKLSVCNNLYQYKIPFTNTSIHTYPISSQYFREDLKYFASVCRVVKGLKNARLAQIGTRPAAFQTVRYSEKLLQDSGITVVPVDLSEIIAAANSLKDSDSSVKAKISEMKAYGSIAADIKEENIIKSAKLSLAMEKFISDNECVAGAMQCWSSIEQNYGCASCLPMSMLSDKGIPMACETDIAGAVSMYAMYLASGQPSGYLDWNNNFGNDRNKCVNFHCSNFPKKFIAKEFEISNLDILGNNIGYEKCFGACKANIAPGEMTFAKISTDERWGVIKTYFGQGEFTDDYVDTHGGRVVCRIENLQKLLDYMCTNGFEHHVAMNRSRVASVLNEAFEKYMGWETYWHK
ncbi:MAG: fucose isomerase [Actinobacteria bacterium]|nr:fucose isomerase [Actinomycetota bacterium]